MAFYVQSFVYVPSLSSPLLLRISPHTFAFIPIPPMSLSSRNRSNSKAFCLILPCVAPVCEGMHYHKTGVPWQMKSTRIIKISYHKKPRNAVFWGILPTCFFYYKSYILSADFAKYGKTVQFTHLIRSKIVVKIFGITTLDFAPPLEYF